MSEYRAPINDIRFLLKHVFDVETLWNSLDGLGDIDIDTADAILDEARKICEEVIGPLNREADEEGSVYKEGVVVTPKGFKEAYQTFCDGGWNGLSGNPDYDGMGMPKTLVSAIEEMVQGSCISFGLAPMLTAGASFAINAHASEELKLRYLPKMYSGQWSGAMDLTEPHAGTDLGMIRTKAIPQQDGSYAVTGTKIFITWGEHDMAENIIHLVLAKLPDAPEGSRGISMFLVPKFLPTEDGNLGERNAVNCGSIEKKMGIKASATCVMNYDGAKGWLVGDMHKGLAAMFTMMNYERLLVGVQGISVAHWSYTSAADYALERIQSRAPDGVKTPEKDADPIVFHPDVRRMLMTMRAYNEGGRAFYLYVAKWLDIAKFSSDKESREHAEQLVALLTPVAKAFMTDVALDTSILGQQIFGGHGYVREWGQEQHVRDIRITQIYEGTNGIQAMDLVGRKTLAAKAAPLKLLAKEIRECIGQGQANYKELSKQLEQGLEKLENATNTLIERSAKSPTFAGALAVDYLNMLGYVSYGFMWLKMTIASDFDGVDAKTSESKHALAEFYFAYLLPNIDLIAKRIESSADTIMSLGAEHFEE